MENIFLFRAVFLLVASIAVFATGSSLDYARLENSRGVKLEGRQSHDLMASIKRLVRRETIRRHKYHLLSNWQLMHHIRRKRGWIGDDPINRATEIPGASSTTPSSPPPPPINPSILSVTDRRVSVVALTTTTSPTVTTTAQTTMKSVATTKAGVTSTVQMTSSSISTSATTESSSAPGLIHHCHHVLAVIVTTFILHYM